MHLSNALVHQCTANYIATPYLEYNQSLNPRLYPNLYAPHTDAQPINPH